MDTRLHRFYVRMVFFGFHGMLARWLQFMMDSASRRVSLLIRSGLRDLAIPLSIRRTLTFVHRIDIPDGNTWHLVVVI